MSVVWETQCESHTEKLVLLAIADNANDQGYCYPSLATLAKKTDLCRFSVIQQVEKLEKRGFLRVFRSINKSNDYQITLPGMVVNAVDHPSQRRRLPVVNAVDPIRQFNRQVNHQGEGNAPRSAGAEPKKRPEFWQLSKDRDRLRKQIREAKEMSISDPEIVAGLQSQLRVVNEAIKSYAS